MDEVLNSPTYERRFVFRDSRNPFSKSGHVTVDLLQYYFLSYGLGVHRLRLAALPTPMCRERRRWCHWALRGTAGFAPELGPRLVLLMS